MLERSSFAFFDADGTLLNLRTMFDFESYWLEYDRFVRPDSVAEEDRMKRKYFLEQLAPKLRRTDANKLFYRAFAGRIRNEVLTCIKHWYEELQSSGYKYRLTETIVRLEDLRKKGVTPVIVSGSFVDLLRPFAKELGIKHILATQLVMVDGIYTGATIGGTMIGKGKQIAIKSFLKNQKADPQNCYAFGDHLSDFPMLQYVSHGHVVVGDEKLKLLAAAFGWKVINNQIKS